MILISVSQLETWHDQLCHLLCVYSFSYLVFWPILNFEVTLLFTFVSVAYTSKQYMLSFVFELYVNAAYHL